MTNPIPLLLLCLQMAKPKPLVQIATLCESVITEQDKVASIIRVIDTVYLQRPPNLAKDQLLAVQLKIFVALKSGDVTGEFDLELRLRTPSGKTGEGKKWHVLFLGNESGATARVDFTLPVKEFGLYWYEVVFEGEVLTSIPIKLVEGQKPGTEDLDRERAAIR